MLILTKESTQNCMKGNFPGGPLVKNLPCNAGNVGLIPGLETKIPQTSRQLSLRPVLKIPCATTKTPHNQI